MNSVGILTHLRTRELTSAQACACINNNCRAINTLELIQILGFAEMWRKLHLIVTSHVLFVISFIRKKETCRVQYTTKNRSAIEGLGVSSGTVSCGVILKRWNPFDIGFLDDPLRRNHWLVGFFGNLCRLYGTVRGLSGSLGPTGAARRQRRLYSSRSLAAVKQDGNCHTPLHSFDMYILQLLCSVSFFFLFKKKVPE